MQSLQSAKPHQWQSGSALTTGRQDVPGSIPDLVCRSSRLEFSVVFSECRKPRTYRLGFLRKTFYLKFFRVPRTIIELTQPTNQPFNRQFDIPLQTREEAYSIPIYRFPNVLFFHRTTWPYITYLAILYSGTLQLITFAYKMLVQTTAKECS